MSKPLFILFIFISALQAYTLDDAQKMCDMNQTQKAVKIYELLSNNGNDTATSRLIEIYRAEFKIGCRSRNIKKLHLLLEKLAKKDISVATVIAHEYMLGIDRKKDMEKAEYWLTKYRDISNPKDQYDIAEAYSIVGVYDKALEWYLKSGKQNYVDSFFCLGDIYSYGYRRVLINPKKALFWFEKCANLGNLTCMKETVKIYHWSFKNEKKYIYWLEKIANEKSNNDAQYDLGVYYFNDNSKYTDKKKAAYWIEQAHKHGSKEAKIFWDDNELWRY